MTETYSRLFAARALVWTLARRELKARYRGSALGFFWSIVHPLLLLTVYSVVFTLIFKPRADVHPYAVFLFGGVLAWSLLSASLLDSAETFRNNGPLLRKVIVAPEIFPGVSVAAQAAHFLLALPVLAAATAASALWFSGAAGWALLQFFPVMALFTLFVLGGALLVSAVSVHFRDLRDLLQGLLPLWFFASPVIYPLEGLPGKLRGPLALNPAACFFEAIHDSIFFNRPIPASRWLAMAAAATVSLAVGGAVFSRLRDSIAEEA